MLGIDRLISAARRMLRWLRRGRRRDRWQLLEQQMSEARDYLSGLEEQLSALVLFLVLPDLPTGLNRVLGSQLDQLSDVGEMGRARDGLEELVVRLERKIRHYQAADSGYDLSHIMSHDGKETLTRAVLLDEQPWSDPALSKVNLPTMITEEDARYYQFIGKFFSGQGEVLQLIASPDESTCFILRGLISNPQFGGKKLHVYDDTIWRSRSIDRRGGGADMPQSNATFNHLSDPGLSPYLNCADLERGQALNHEGNRAGGQGSWEHGLIEMAFIRCGKRLATNEAAYSALATHFIPNKTLIIMQDWGNSREIPLQPDSRMVKLFTDARASSLEMVHELSRGHVATFLFKGRPCESP